MIDGASNNEHLEKFEDEFILKLFILKLTIVLTVFPQKCLPQSVSKGDASYIFLIVLLDVPIVEYYVLFLENVEERHVDDLARQVLVFHTIAVKRLRDRAEGAQDTLVIEEIAQEVISSNQMK